MSLYKRRILVHGAAVNTHLACPFDGTTDLKYPVYLNKYNPSGLVQPYGPINDNKLVSTNGIVRPRYNDDPSGYFRPVPSGLQHTYTHAYANGTDGYGRDNYTAFKEGNWYQNYWTCPSGHFFIFPSGVAADMPGGAAVGNNSNTPPSKFGNFE